MIDIRGRVVALNAGGSSGAASSFYLPLARVQRALERIQAGQPITRGTLQTVFSYTPYDELERLGLAPETEAEASRPSVADRYAGRERSAGLRRGECIAAGRHPGRIDGKFVTTFEPLAEVLDESVSKGVTLEVQRGGTVIEKTLEVENLHAITPNAYLEFGDSVVHNLSYQMARHFNAAVSGVFVANPGYALGSAGVPRGALITSIAGQPVAALPDFTKAVAALPDGGDAALRYTTLDDPKGTQTRVVRMDRRWFPARECRRDDTTGYWPCTDLPAPPPPQPKEPARTSFAITGSPIADALAGSLVLVNFDMPFSVAGISERNYHGTGLIVDAARGLVVIDRNTVPVAVGDVKIVFAGSVELPGRVEYVHPLHNLSIVSFDPKLLNGTPIRTARLDLRELRAGEPVTVVGLGADTRLRSLATSVASIEPVVFPLSRTLQFRDSNLEVASLVTPPTDFDGVIAGPGGAVRALWSSFSAENNRELVQLNRGIPAELVAEVLKAVQTGEPLYSLEAEFSIVPLASARQLGVPEEWLRRMEAHSPTRRQILSVARVVAGSPAVGVLREGDLLLAIDGKPVNRYREVERASQSPKLMLTVVRDGIVQNLALTTAVLRGSDIDRLLMWAGAVLHKPHRAMAQQRGIPPDGVFVAYFSYGSPATRYHLFAGRRIVEVDGRPTPDLDAFIEAVRGRDDRAAVRLRTITWNGSTEVITLKLDKHYWPAYELVRGPAGWERVELD